MDVHPTVALETIGRFQPCLVGLIRILLGEAKPRADEQHTDDKPEPNHRVMTEAHANPPRIPRHKPDRLSFRVANSNERQGATGWHTKSHLASATFLQDNQAQCQRADCRSRGRWTRLRTFTANRRCLASPIHSQWSFGRISPISRTMRDARKLSKSCARKSACVRTTSARRATKTCSRSPARESFPRSASTSCAVPHRPRKSSSETT